jgi:hypothetical protein
MQAELGRSKRGGGSAPSHCRTGLRRCMVLGVKNASNLGGLAKACMTSFNRCRSKRRR